MAKDWGKWKYEYAYNLVGLNKVPKRIGFNVDAKVLTKANFEEWKSKISSADFTALDTETMIAETGKPTLRFNDATCTLIIISVPGNQNLVMFWTPELVKEQTRPQLGTRDQIKTLVKLCLNRKSPTFFWNRLFDQRVLLNPINNADNWLVPEDFFNSIDGMGLLWSIDSNNKFNKGLKPNAADFLGLEMSSFEDSVTDNWFTTDIKQAVRYAALDGYATIELSTMLYRIVQDHCPIWTAMDRQLQSALYYLENQEVYTSIEPLKDLEKVVLGKLEGVTSEFYAKYGLINLGSPAQKAKLLQGLGYSSGAFSEKTGAMSTAKTALEGLANSGCDPARLMLDFNKYKTLANNFVTKVINHLERGLPTRFHLLAYSVPTLRFASGSYKIGKKKDDYYEWFVNVNSQALSKPKKAMRELNFNTETKEIQFLPDDVQGEYFVEAGVADYNARCWIGNHPGYTIVETDYSAQEIWIPANLSGEPVWLEAYRQGKDVHKVTAAMIFGKPEEEIVYAERQTAKKLNFGLMYGYYDPTDYNGAIYTAVSRCGIAPEVAAVVVPKYIQSLPVLYNWKLRVYAEAQRTGMVENIYGFKYKVQSYLKSGNPKMIKYGKKLGINVLGQGGGGFLSRFVLIKAAKTLYYPNAPWKDSGVTYVDMVHDSITFSVPNHLLDKWIPVQIDLMESVCPQNWECKLRADPSIGFDRGQLFAVVKRDDGVWVPKSEPEKRKSRSEVTDESMDIGYADDDDDSADFDGFDDIL